MRQLYIEITTKNKKDTTEYTGKFKIIEDNKNRAYIHTILPMSVDFVIEDTVRKLGFKNSQECLEKSMYYVLNNNLMPKLTKEAYMFSKPLFNVNKYNKKIRGLK